MNIQQESQKTQTSYILKVNLHCGACEQKVKKLMHKIDGVYSVSIDREHGKVVVAGNVDPTRLINTLKRSGKNAEMWDGHNQNYPNNNLHFNNFQVDNNGNEVKYNDSHNQNQDGQEIAQFQNSNGPRDVKVRIEPHKSVNFNLPVMIFDDKKNFDEQGGYGHCHIMHNKTMMPSMENGHRARGPPRISNGPNDQSVMFNGPNSQLGMFNGPNDQPSTFNGPNGQPSTFNGPYAAASTFNRPYAPTSAFSGSNAPPDTFNGPIVQAGKFNGPNAQVSMVNRPKGPTGMVNGSNGPNGMVNGSNGPNGMFNGSNPQPVMVNGPNAQANMFNGPNTQVGMVDRPNGPTSMLNGPNTQVGMVDRPNGSTSMLNGSNGQNCMFNGPNPPPSTNMPNAQASMFNGPNAPPDMFNGPNAPPDMFNGPNAPIMNNHKGYGGGDGNYYGSWKGVDGANIPIQMMDKCTCKGGNYNEIRSGNERGMKCNVDYASKNKEVDINKKKKKSVGGLLGRYLGFNNKSSKNGKEWKKFKNDLNLFEFDLLRHNAKMGKRGRNGIVGQMGPQIHQNGPMAPPMHQNSQMGQPMQQNGPMGQMGQPMQQNGPMDQMGQAMHQNGPMGQAMHQNGPMGQAMHQSGPMGQTMNQNGPMGQMEPQMYQNGSIGQMRNVPSMDKGGSYNHQQQQDITKNPMMIDQQQKQQHQPNMNMHQPAMLSPMQSHTIVDPFTYVFSDENTEASCSIM